MSRNEEVEDRTPKALLSKGMMTHDEGKRIEAMNVGLTYDDASGNFTMIDQKAHQEYNAQFRELQLL